MPDFFFQTLIVLYFDLCRLVSFRVVFMCRVKRWLPIGTHTRAQFGSTALIRAAAKGRMACVRVLLDAGANKNVRDEVRRAGPLRLLFST